MGQKFALIQKQFQNITSHLFKSPANKFSVIILFCKHTVLGKSLDIDKGKKCPLKCCNLLIFSINLGQNGGLKKDFWSLSHIRKLETYVFSPSMKIMIKVASLSLQTICIYIFYFLFKAHFWFLLSYFSFSLSTFSATLLILTFYHKVPTESYLSQLSWQDSPLYTEMQPEKRLSQPPSPAPGQQPLQTMDMWEQYSDLSTGRIYYVNSITKERSWKPPRRARGRTANKVTHFTLVLRAFFSPSKHRMFGYKGNKNFWLWPAVTLRGALREFLYSMLWDKGISMDREVKVIPRHVGKYKRRWNI